MLPVRQLQHMQPTLIEEVKSRQMEDSKLKKLSHHVRENPNAKFSIDGGVMKFGNRLCVPNVPNR